MAGQGEKAIQTSVYSIIGNILLATVKLVTGILGQSFALIADAIESMSDIIASVIVFLGLKYSTRKPDENHPYGHGKAEPLVTFVVVGFLLVSATIIIIQSIKNILSPQLPPQPFTLIVLGAIIIIKEGFYRFVNRRSKETDSTSLKADAWHHRSDAITSAMAFVGIVISIYFGEGFEKAEDIAALVAAFIIIYNAFLIFRPALGEIMDEHVYDEQVSKIKKFATGVPGIIATEKCYVRKSGMDYFIDVHIIVDAKITVSEGHYIGHQLKDGLMEAFPQIKNVLVHVEPDRYI
jgi:cation diffusion facilitator family transporter